MGIFKMFTMDAERIRNNAANEAARVKQAAYNEASRSIVDSKRKVQTANNAASTAWAVSQRQVQDANNAAARKLEAVANKLQASRNDASKAERLQKLKVQSVYNDQAKEVNEAKKVLQAARNERSASKSTLSLHTTSITNKQVMDEAGRRINSISEEIGRTMAGATSGRAFERLANSELLGSALAQASVAGVGGSFIEQYNSAIDLRQSLKEEAQDRELRARVYAAGQARGDTLRKMAGGMSAYDGAVELDHSILIADQDYAAVMDETDYSPVFSNQDYTAINDVQDFEVYSPQIDYTVYEDQKKMSGFAKAATWIGAGVATYFGGPAAGQAVMGASMAMHEARNGNFAGASAYGNQAMQNATTGFNTWRASADNKQGGSSWGSDMLAKAGVNFKI